MAVGINEGLGGTDADSFTWNSEYPVAGENNDTFQFRWNWWIAKVAIENLQSKIINVTGDVTGDSTVFDSDDIPVPLTLTLSDTGVVAGNYSLASLTVDSKGRIIAITDNSADYVPASGGAFTGIITVPAITGGSPGDAAATKDYVDFVGGGGAGTFVLTDGSVTMSSALEYDALVVTANDDQVPNKAEVKNYVTPITNALSANKLNIAGGTMTGSLILNADPTLALGAATKDYVDTEIASNITGFYPTTGGALSGDVDLLNSNQVVNMIDPIDPQDAATKAYVDTEITNLIDSAPGTLNTLNELAAALGNDPDFSTTITTSVGEKVSKAGDTMTGDLILNADPTLALGAVTKQYADTLFLPFSGGTLTGDLILNADPTLALGAVTKQYADTFLPLAGGTLTGDLILNADPTLALGAATKQYVDNSIPTDHIKQDGTVAMTANLDLGTNKVINVVDPTNPQDAATKAYVDFVGTGGVAILADGTVAMTADLDLGTNKVVNVVDPTLAQDAATKAYVDLFLPLAGGTLTGSLILDGDPTVSLQASTKQYVDNTTMTLDGTNFMAADLNVGTNKIINVVNPSDPQDAATKAYVDMFAPLSGATFTGDIILNADPTLALGAVTKQYVDNSIPTDHIKQDGTIAMLADLDLGTNKVINVVDPTNPQDVATKNYVDNSISEKFTSSPQVITTAGQLILPHGLSSDPVFVGGYLVCTTSEHGYSIGDKIWHNREGSGGVSMVFDSTNITIRYANVANIFEVLDKSTGDPVNLTNTSWNYLVVART